MADKILLGWRENVFLPALHKESFKAKVDTGAKTSCLHAWDFEFLVENNILYVDFSFAPEDDSHQNLRARAELADQREVTNSGGESTKRPIIKTELVLGDIKKPIEISLVNREKMEFKMLLGREALRDHFFVDPSKSFQI